MALAAHPRVESATAAVREAATRLRWSEALRRRWREARAEVAIREAVASAACEGALVPAARLRAAVAQGQLGQAVSEDPAVDVAAGVWRAQVRLNDAMADLRGSGRARPVPAAALLAGLHRDVVGPLVVAGRLEAGEIAVLRRGEVLPREGGPGPVLTGTELDERLRGLLWLIDGEGVPALVRIALVHAEMVCVRPFTAGSAAVGRALVRHLAVRDGLEPTGVAVTARACAEQPGAYAQALAGYASGSAEGVLGWIQWQAQALLRGVDEGLGLCREIQAGSVRVSGTDAG